jgi:Endosomal/lysosomal potassium channel TMEM175
VTNKTMSMHRLHEEIASALPPQLDALPRLRGFRLRGIEMTRLETFVDATFAFAISILVIAASRIPENIDELLAVFKNVPAFVTSIAVLGIFWRGHLVMEPALWPRRRHLDLSQLGNDCDDADLHLSPKGDFRGNVVSHQRRTGRGSAGIPRYGNPREDCFRHFRARIYCDRIGDSAFKFAGLAIA